MSESDSVLIVGAGPVGLCLALDLAERGVEVSLIEQRYALERPSVKCNHVSSRTMETFRRLGLAKAVREVGLPDDYPNDAVVRTPATGCPPRPSRRCGRQGRSSGMTDGGSRQRAARPTARSACGGRPAARRTATCRPSRPG